MTTSRRRLSSNTGPSASVCRSRYVRPISLHDEEQTIASVKVSSELYRSTVGIPCCACNQQRWHVRTSADQLELAKV
jgi:hypothetical protein